MKLPAALIAKRDELTENCCESPGPFGLGDYANNLNLMGAGKNEIR
jgi:hypothetical protein